MLRERLRVGVWIGLVAAAASAGALVGFGWVRGVPLQPLNAVAHIVVGNRAFQVNTAHPLVTSAGIVVHAISLLAWGIVLSLILGRSRASLAWAIALAFAAVVAFIDLVVLPAPLSPGFETILTRRELVVVYVVMGVAMAWGAGKFRVEGGKD
jgi:hypothetical protein